MSNRQSFRNAVYVFLVKNKQILLIKRANTGYMDSFYSTLAGHVEKDESIIDAAIREAKEEGGIKINPKKLTLFHIMNRDSDRQYIDFFYKTTDWQNTPTIAEPQFCSDLTWFNLDKLPKNTIPYIKFVIGKINLPNLSYSKFP